MSKNILHSTHIFSKFYTFSFNAMIYKIISFKYNIKMYIKGRGLYESITEAVIPLIVYIDFL